MNTSGDMSYVNRYSVRYKKLVLETSSKVGGYINAHTGQVWVSWSGGKDSTATLLLCLQHSPDIPVIFFNSGFEYPENIEYLNLMKEKYNINLRVVTPSEDAFTTLKRSGMWNHETLESNSAEDGITDADFHNVLIREPSLRACHMFGFYNLTGLRTEESNGRRILLSSHKGEYTTTLNTPPPSSTRSTSSVLTTLCPLWRWSGLDVVTFLQENGVPENGVYTKLKELKVPEFQQRVGMIFDGNALETGRLTHVKNGWPELWAHLVKNFPRVEEWV